MHISIIFDLLELQEKSPVMVEVIFALAQQEYEL